MRLTEREYYDEICTLAAEAVKEARKGTFGTGEEAREGLQEWVHETLDGHEYVIYTAQAQSVISISNNDGAYVENYGSDGLVKNGELNWSALAYAAMEADLLEALNSTGGFDVNDPCPEA
jgi:hypothetical protein